MPEKETINKTLGEVIKIINNLRTESLEWFDEDDMYSDLFHRGYISALEELEEILNK